MGLKQSPSKWKQSECHSHSNHVLDIKVLQWGHVWVVTLVVLQDDLLDDAVQEKPILHGIPTAFICHREKTDGGRDDHKCQSTIMSTTVPSHTEDGGRYNPM